MTIEASIIVAVITAIVSVIAARYQSAAIAKSTLESAEASFRESLMKEIFSLRADVKQHDADNNALVIKNAALSAQIITLESRLERFVQDLTTRNLERDELKRQVESQQKEITQLRAEVDKLQKELHIERNRVK